MTTNRENIIEPLTDEEKATWPKDVIVTLEKPFVDVRGALRPLVDRLMKSAVLIESSAGTIRANHYHKTDWHYAYLLSGEMDYYHRPTGTSHPPERLRVKTGQMIYTPPMVDHAMVFPTDTVFLTLSRNPRDQASYEADVVRIDMVSTKDLVSWKPQD
jgi:quercetin dioxygenase-like cupin family protein